MHLCNPPISCFFQSLPACNTFFRMYRSEGNWLGRVVRFWPTLACSSPFLLFSSLFCFHPLWVVSFVNIRRLSLHFCLCAVSPIMHVKVLNQFSSIYMQSLASILSFSNCCRCWPQICLCIPHFILPGDLPARVLTYMHVEADIIHAHVFENECSFSWYEESTLRLMVLSLPKIRSHLSQFFQCTSSLKKTVKCQRSLMHA